MPIRRRLKADLRAAMSAGDTQRVSVVRTLLAAIGNAEAIDLDASHPKEVQGWGDVARRELTTADLARIVRREAEELRSAADDYERHGQPDEAERLRSRASLVDGYLADLA
jgi:uncharacterized protein YqeY